MKKGVKLYGFLPMFMVLCYFSNSLILFDGIMSGGEPLDFRVALWFVPSIPVFWIITFPSYIIVYFIVTKILFKFYEIKLKNKDYGRLLIKYTFLGFAFDILTSIIILLLSYRIANISFGFIETEMGKWWYEISVDMLVNPFNNIVSLLIICTIIFIVKYINYRINLKYCMNNIEIDEAKKKKLALYTIILTTPYFYLIPTEWFV